MAAVAALMLSAPAEADCIDALAEQLRASSYEQTAYFDDLKKTLGPNTGFDFNFADRCTTMVPVAKRRLPFVDKVIVADANYRAWCPELLDDEDEEQTTIDGHLATEMRNILIKYIAVCEAGGGND